VLCHNRSRIAAQSQSTIRITRTPAFCRRAFRQHQVWHRCRRSGPRMRNGLRAVFDNWIGSDPGGCRTLPPRPTGALPASVPSCVAVHGVPHSLALWSRRPGWRRISVAVVPASAQTGRSRLRCHRAGSDCYSCEPPGQPNPLIVTFSASAAPLDRPAVRSIPAWLASP